MGQLDSKAEFDSIHEQGLLGGSHKPGPIPHEDFWRERLERYEARFADTPEDPYVISQRALCYRKLRMYDESLEDLDRLIVLTPEDRAAWNDRGLTHTMMKQFGPALSDFSRAIEIDENDSMAYFNRGAAYLFDHKAVQAESDFTKAIEIEVREQEEMVAERDSLSGDEAALAEMDKRIGKGKQALADVYVKRAISFKKQKRYDEALADLDTSVEWGDQVSRNVVQLREAIEKLQRRG